MLGQLRVQYLGQVIVDDWGPEHFRESSVDIHHTSSRTGGVGTLYMDSN